MKKRVIIILMFLIIAASILTITFLPKKQEKTYTKKQTIENISKGFASGISKKELENLMNQEIADKTVMTGKDAYLLKKPAQEKIEKYNLNSYVKENEKYFSALEKKIKDNYSWKFEGTFEENQTTYFITLKTYSYGVYLSDLEEMVMQLMSRVNSDNPKEINEYKAKVISMKLLNSHIDDYIYNGEEKTISISFANPDSDETKNSLMQYLVDLAGYNNLTDEKINALEQNRQTRITEYIDAALNDGTLNKNNILKIWVL